MARTKGRDVFDTWFLLKKEAPLNWELTKREFNRKKLIKKIESFSVKKLNLDLAKFLPKSYRKMIEELKPWLVQELSS